MSFGKRQSWLSERKKSNNITQQANKIVLFDMDGTLTEPRKSFDRSLINSLIFLSNKCHIGIVTGSDFNYIKQQLEYLLNSATLRPKLHLLPCNGTKYYPPAPLLSSNFEIQSEADMKKEVGEDNFKQMMVSLIELQSELDFRNFSLTGHFISYRGSTVNFCPIGRNAGDKERKEFVDYDLKSSPSYREKIIHKMKEKFKSKNIDHLLEIKLGGSTSFDIYPIGWNKTFCLQHFPDWEVWFVGDKCKEGGNDKELYDALKKSGRSYETKNTYNTKLIIENDIIPNL